MILAVTIGATEIGLILSAAGVTGAILTLAGRYAGSRAVKLRMAKEEGEREAKERLQVEQLQKDVREHLEQTASLVKEFGDQRVTVAQTVENVKHLTRRVGELVDSNEELNTTVRKLITGELAWRPPRSNPSSTSDSGSPAPG